MKKSLLAVALVVTLSSTQAFSKSIEELPEPLPETNTVQETVEVELSATLYEYRRTCGVGTGSSKRACARI
jgi:hypothetical protein